MMRNVREVATDLLLKIDRSQAYSNLLLNQAIRKNKFSGKDAALLTEIVYGTLQRKNTLDYYLKGFIKKPLNKLEDWVLVLLRLSVYQMVYLDRVPDHAIINEAVVLAKKRGHKGISGFVNGVLRNVQRKGIPGVASIPDKRLQLAIECSHPEWLVNRWIDQFGNERTREMCTVNNTPPKVTARVNRLKLSIKDAIERLKDESVNAEPSKLVPEGIRIISGNLPESDVYKSGALTIQDESSMLVGYALDPQPDERILDACAAPGGKTTHLAERMDNQGEITAIDLHEHKVKLIEQQVERLGLTNIETIAMDTRKAAKLFKEESFDRVLLDAPCTGFGVIRRKPDIKWGKKPEDIERIQIVQEELLEAVSRVLKIGGLLVYSTCTIESEENNIQVQRFLDRHPEFEWDEALSLRMPATVKPYISETKDELQILPQYFNSDGFYIACLRKTSRKGGVGTC
ncbi:16S rRNA (cytosine(967)-C(5))-methyltransferase RsmB [Pseudalkalibacillus salsuginis]|uniref:16S rRNA (cytosine(967)-C(5))-methyltransferase RsmB n=1 Tax=Pseudalkalibacillus salsuginis TaxID=2910972 RepID=UPI001F32E1BE|nr:16S rRNA (cytosine(967)-C(5))-methyltransferase RsmB [Pseudalkalibacillus salsuginis]MCF6410515.1 16S rRNA (cytosine(967)-C(5))-methyltransferase RsmB [Pseudalkalibacillus salsuginis]